jgi:hypothetical protein
MGLLPKEPTTDASLDGANLQCVVSVAQVDTGVIGDQLHDEKSGSQRNDMVNNACCLLCQEHAHTWRSCLEIGGIRGDIRTYISTRETITN